MEGFKRITSPRRPSHQSPRILIMSLYTFVYSLNGKQYKIDFEAKDKTDAKCIIIQQLARTKDPRRMRDILDCRGRSII